MQPSVIKIVFYRFHSNVFPESVNAQGLLLLLLLGGDIPVNPGQTMGLLNVQSIENKGAILSDITGTQNLDVLCLTEARIRPSDALLKSLTPTNYVLLHRSRLTGLGGGASCIVKESYSPHIPYR